MGSKDIVVRSIWTKGLFIAAFAFVGIVGGMLVGHLIVGQKPAEAEPNIGSKPQGFYLSLRTGDLFPYEDYTTTSGSKGNFKELLDNKESVIFFVDLLCEPCHKFLRAWKDTLSKRLKPEVQVVVCLPNSTKSIPPEFAGLVTGDTVVFIDADLWKNRYHLVFYPIITGADDSGFLTHIQYGFADEVDFEIAQRYLTAEKSSN